MKLIAFFAVFLSILVGSMGIIFLSLLIHEGTHIVQSIEPIDICYSLQGGSFAYVTHARIPNEGWIGYTEKWAYFLQYFSLIFLSASIAMVLTLEFTRRKKC